MKNNSSEGINDGNNLKKEIANTDISHKNNHPTNSLSNSNEYFTHKENILKMNLCKDTKSIKAYNLGYDDMNNENRITNDKVKPAPPSSIGNPLLVSQNSNKYANVQDTNVNRNTNLNHVSKGESVRPSSESISYNIK